MDSIKVSCPNCGKEFSLEAGIIAQIKDTYKDQVTNEVTEKLNDHFSLEIDDLKDQVKEKEDQLKKSRKAELDYLKKSRNLEEKENNLELEIERQLGERISETSKAIEGKIRDEYEQKTQEKDKRISDFEKKVGELQSKLDQSSQQLVGEIKELELEKLLNNTFPFDQISPVPKGKSGADVIQEVRNNKNQVCGKMLWESKNTKSWTNSWLGKLKEDQRGIKADIAVIVSKVLPEGINHFGCMNDVWIVSFDLVIEVAYILRNSLINIYDIHLANANKGEKTDILYEYLCGNEFRERIFALVEAFSQMREDLHKEKQAIEGLWSKREKQISKFIKNVDGIYGDVKGIVGGALPVIESLELPQLVEGDN